MFDQPPLPLVVDLPRIPTLPSCDSFSTSEATDCGSSKEATPSQLSSSIEIENVDSIWAKQSVSKAEKISMFANDIGVCGAEHDEVYVQKIHELEARDKEVRGKMAANPGSK